ncbi:hypothetical protein BD414DRAFT_485631 [Trametes punicea]|nr:hypothetical protein BD414DRAFT_485631 [Trametes punicea]
MVLYILYWHPGDGAMRILKLISALLALAASISAAPLEDKTAFQRKEHPHPLAGTHSPPAAIFTHLFAESPGSPLTHDTTHLFDDRPRVVEGRVVCFFRGVPHELLTLDSTRAFAPAFV